MYPFRTILAAALSGALLMAPTDASATETQGTLQQAATPTVQDELLRMATQAAVIFAGEVLRVTPRSGSVEVAFRVDRPIRGCDGQSTYTLREWSGLWTGGRQRYVPGQRLLILLHAPSASGLSSPVGGQDGVIPIVGTGTAPKPTDTFIAQAEPSVDLRWVQARIPRATALVNGTRAHSFTAATSAYVGRELAPFTTRKAMPPATPRSLGPSSVDSGATLPLSSTGSRGITLRSILAILGAWQAQQSNASH